MTVGLHCPVVCLDGQPSEEGNPCFDLGTSAHVSVEFGKSSGEKEPWRAASRWMNDLSRLDSVSGLKV